jgi:hypothetical protein
MPAVGKFSTGVGVSVSVGVGLGVSVGDGVGVSVKVKPPFVVAGEGVIVPEGTTDGETDGDIDVEGTGVPVPGVTVGLVELYVIKLGSFVGVGVFTVGILFSAKNVSTSS